MTAIEHCGERSVDPALQAGLDWLGEQLQRPRATSIRAAKWKYYYLYGLAAPPGGSAACAISAATTGIARAPRSSSGSRTPSRGLWQGVGQEADPLLATSFAVLFLAEALIARADQQAQARAAGRLGQRSRRRPPTSTVALARLEEPG